jgi:hypothetical protein
MTIKMNYCKKINDLDYVENMTFYSKFSFLINVFFLNQKHLFFRYLVYCKKTKDN